MLKLYTSTRRYQAIHLLQQVQGFSDRLEQIVFARRTPDRGLRLSVVMADTAEDIAGTSLLRA